MEHSSYVWRGEFEANVAFPHDPEGTSQPNRHVSEPNAAYSLLTTASDYARFLAALLRGDELEQERSRAHQMVCQKLEVERCQLFTWTHTNSVQTLWDNATPLDLSDDTTGTLKVIVKNAKTGEELTVSPNPAVLVEIEATLEWFYRGGRLEGNSLRETAMTFKAP